MSKKVRFIIFPIIFLLIYTTLNAYVILRLGSYLDINKNSLYILTLLATFSVPVSIYIEKKLTNILSKIFYIISTLWMGILNLALFLLLIYEFIRPFYIIQSIGIIIVIIVAILTLISVINASIVIIKNVEIPIKNLKKEITIVQLSDLHIGTIRGSSFLKKIIEKTKKINPDLVLITGDLVDNNSRVKTGMFEDFKKLKSLIYFITGNHEVYEGINEIYSHLGASNIEILDNKMVNFNEIQIIGIEFSEDKNHVKKELDKMGIDKIKPSVLMYHSPEGFEDAKTFGIDLQLAGHTHYGQIFPFNFLVRMRYKYTKGLYDLKGMFLYVSPGTGTWGPYMRLGSRNEITVLRLKKDNSIKLYW